MKKRQFKKLINGTRGIKPPFKIGQIVTVVRWTVPLSDGVSFDRSYIGDGLEVMAVDLPFIKVKLSCVGLKGYIKTFSLDEVELKVLTKSFANIKTGGAK